MGFEHAARVATMRVWQFAEFVRNNPGAQAALLAVAGDLLVPLYRDHWSYGATAFFCAGEANLFAFSKNRHIRRNPWMLGAAYGCFAVGMELLTHSIGVAHNPLLKLNLWAFSRLDVVWASAYALKTAGLYVRKKYSRYRKIGHLFHKIGDRGAVVAGTAATFLHLPGLAGSVGLSGPFNIVTLGGHSCWLGADYIIGNVKKAARLLQRGAIRAVRGPELMLMDLRSGSGLKTCAQPS